MRASGPTRINTAHTDLVKTTQGRRTQLRRTLPSRERVSVRVRHHIGLELQPCSSNHQNKSLCFEKNLSVETYSETHLPQERLHSRAIVTRAKSSFIDSTWSPAAAARNSQAHKLSYHRFVCSTEQTEHTNAVDRGHRRRRQQWCATEHGSEQSKWSSAARPPERRPPERRELRSFAQWHHHRNAARRSGAMPRRTTRRRPLRLVAFQHRRNNDAAIAATLRSCEVPRGASAVGGRDLEGYLLR